MLPEYLATTLFVDIETVSTSANYADLPDSWKKLWGKQVKQSYRDQYNGGVLPPDEWAYKEKASLHAEFAKIACLSMGYLIEQNGQVTLRVKPLVNDITDPDGEKKLLNTFATVSKKFKRLCAHNGKRFDFPFITRRCIINSLDVPEILQIGNKKPWEIENVDTMDLWRFGDMPFPSLELLCATLGIEGKDEGFDGSMVHGAYYNELYGGVKGIVKYCAQDVHAVAELLLRLGPAGVKIDNVVLA